jgi:hypothetical protein
MQLLQQLLLLRVHLPLRVHLLLRVLPFLPVWMRRQSPSRPTLTPPPHCALLWRPVAAARAAACCLM